MPLVYAAQLSYQHLPPLRTIDKYLVQLDPYRATHIVYRVPSRLHRESHHVRWTFETTSSQFTSMSWVSFGMFPSSVWRQMSRSGSSGWVLAPSRKCRTSDKDLIQICLSSRITPLLYSWGLSSSVALQLIKVGIHFEVSTWTLPLRARVYEGRCSGFAQG